MPLDKLEISRRQLGAALALFLENLDPVSVHTLASAGGEIAEHLTRKAGAEPFSTHILTSVPQLDVGHLRRLQNQYWNAFKHAATRDGMDRPDQQLIERFTDDVNDHALFIAWYDYMLASRCRLRRKRSKFGIMRCIRKSSHQAWTHEGFTPYSRS